MEKMINIVRDKCVLKALANVGVYRFNSHTFLIHHEFEPALYFNLRFSRIGVIQHDPCRMQTAQQFPASHIVCLFTTFLEVAVQNRGLMFIKNWKELFYRFLFFIIKTNKEILTS